MTDTGLDVGVNLRALVTAAPCAMLVADDHGVIRLANVATERMFGWRADELIGRPMLALIPERFHQLHLEALAGLRTAPSATGLTLRAAANPRGLHRDGREFRLQVDLSALDSAAGRLVIVTLADVTERFAGEEALRRSQEQLYFAERMASIGTLAAGVAHEINNPLASVIANLDLALRQLADGVAPDLDALRDARQAADRVREIVRDLKVFSRAEEDIKRRVDVGEVLESTLRMAGNEIRHRARLVRDLRPAPPVEANEARLGQVFLNLILNAVQAIPEGAADAHEIRVGVAGDGRGHVVVRIADTGRGIPPEVRGRIFTPFFTTKPIGVGTGLGLSICHKIVTALGGTIEFDTTVGVGTEFRVILPAASPKPAPPTERLPPTARARRGQVLVVDDEPLITRVVARILGAAHDVTSVNAAEDALDRLRSGERFDAILCDLMMPQMSGIDLHGEIVTLAPDQTERIVFMTGGAFTPRAREFLATVPNPRVDKPFDAVALKAVIDRLVSGGVS